MKERPILFSSPMVRALLAGSKTQTRRICKNQPYSNGFHFDGQDILCHNDYLPPSAMLMDIRHGNTSYTASNMEGWETECPYGQPEDQLWVRETWAEVGTMDPGLIVYRADYPACVPNGFENVPPVSDITWKPSIHMFRRHSRITLEIVSVRVERLQDISESDAIAEGIPEDGTPCPRCHCSGWIMQGGYPVQCDAKGCGDGAVDEYRTLWESINGAGSWAANPWVWVVEFRRIEA